MTPTRHITGIHHVTAIAGDPQRNLNFYTQVLGLRLVKLTVNFDDPHTYHLYFGNDTGTPGSILTFFPWPATPRGSIGKGQVSAVAFAVPAGSLEYWRGRLAAHNVAQQEGVSFGERVLHIADPDGIPLDLVETEPSAPTLARTFGPIPAANALRGFHSATLSLDDGGPTAALLEFMGFKFVAEEGSRVRYKAPHDAAAIVDLVRGPQGPPGRLGVGTVHHIAFRTPTDDQQREWRTDLEKRGHNVTPIIDRKYFHSIYYREPGGVLFEIATDPPGFAIDEPAGHLGERLVLPDWLESRRSELERRLPRLVQAVRQ
jgi:glyoxalase family protein